MMNRLTKYSFDIARTVQNHPQVATTLVKLNEIPHIGVAMLFACMVVMLLAYEIIGLWVIKRDVISAGNWAIIKILEEHWNKVAFGWGYRIFIFVILTWLAPHFAFQDKFNYKHQAVVEATLMALLVMSGWIWFRYNIWNKHYF
jgi:hypothetical protein